MTGKQLKNSILQWAIQGKLVPQDPNDEPASVLLERIRAEKARLVKEKKIKKPKNDSIIYRGDDNSYYEKFADGSVCCIDSEIPFEIPEGWAWARLGSFSNLLIGKTPPRGDLQYWASQDYPWIAISDMEDYGRISKTKERVSKYAAQKVFGLISPKTSLIMSFKLTVGRTSILNIDAYHNEAIVTIIPIMDRRFIIRNYLFWVLPLISIEGDSKDAIKGKTLNSKSLSNLLIPLPPIDEQARIIDRIETIAPIVERFDQNQRALNELNETCKPRLRKSILQEALQGKLVPQFKNEETADMLLSRIRAEKAKLIKEKKIKRDKHESVIFRGDDNRYYEKIGKEVNEINTPFDIPSTWEWVRLPNIGISELGKTLDRGRDSGQSTPYLCSINVYWDGINLHQIKEARFSVPERAKYLLKKGDLLVCEGGDVGRCAVWNGEEEMWYQNALHRIRLYGGIAPEFIKLILEYYKFSGEIDKLCKGVTIKHFTRNILYSLLLPLPPIEEQYRIINKLKDLFKHLK